MRSLWESKAYLKHPASPLNWYYCMLRRFRSFHRGIVSLCRSKGSKVTVSQTLKMIPSPWTRLRAELVWFDSGRAAEFFPNLQLWQLVTLQPFDLERPKVPLWKDLEPVVYMVSGWEIGSILKIGFALLKRPHLHRAYLVIGRYSSSETVHMINLKTT